MTHEEKQIPIQIERSLWEDRDEGAEHGEDVASDAAVHICKRLAGAMLTLLARPPKGFTWVVFGEEEGGVTLALRSSVTDRRVDFPICPGKPDVVHAVCIDENLNARTVPVAVGHNSTIRGLAEWVAGAPICGG